MTVRNKVQALLFSSGKYMNEDDIAKLSGEPKAKVKKALQELKELYDKSEDALAIRETNGLWKMGVKDAHHGLVQNIVADTELEMPVLETLAVIAWKRPILQSEVITMRGDHAYAHIRELLDMGFITREKFSRTYKVKLAEKFFEYFDVEGDKDIREMFSVVQRPEKKPDLTMQQKKFGELDVVDLKEEHNKEKKADLEKGKLGQLEVVDTPEVDPLKKWQHDHKELDDMDKELARISQRTDNHLKDFERYQPKEEPEEGEESAEEDEPKEKSE